MRAVLAEDAPLVGTLLARAFHDDPFVSWWYDGAPDRVEQASALFTANARLGLALGDGLMSDDGDAVALYLPPGAVVDDGAVGSSGLPAVIEESGPERAGQIGRFLATLGTLHAETTPEPHWQLFFLGVAPPAQGRGLGGSLVDEMTRRARRDGVPCYLDTLTAANVAFYERRGYRVVAEADVPDSPVHAWAMRIG
jgi:ribosomal protein S18 acetylase RimI-like enzyme